MLSRSRLLLALGCTILGTITGHALSFLSSGDPNHNTSAPTGDLAGSGWQSQSQASFGATAISGQVVATANHLGAIAEKNFIYAGLTYRVVGWTNNPGTDLRLFWVAGRLPNPSPIYEGHSELNATLMYHGFGGPRGNPVYFDPPANTDLRGWLWTNADGRLRWGTNRVMDFLTSTSGLTGEFLIAYFTRDAGDDAITFSGGDSGGGAFIKDTDGRWKLAGVVGAVEAAFRTTPNSATFYASIFNRKGFYEETGDPKRPWALDPSASQTPGAQLQATRVSAYADWIKIQLAAPIPGTPTPLLLQAREAGGPFTEADAYAIDPSKKEITFYAPTGPHHFYQLDGATNIVSITRKSGLITLIYK
jgi:hypothetical protein